MMKRKQFETLVIHEFEEKKFHLPAHTHTYYEIIYITKGLGTHQLNQILIPYQAGDLFLISPGDEHDFNIEESTRFIFVKFSDSYFDDKVETSFQPSFYGNPKTIMQLRQLKEHKMVFTDHFKLLLKNSFSNIVSYCNTQNLSNSSVLYHQILAIFGIIRESQVLNQLKELNDLSLKEEVLIYVHEYIYQPKLIFINEISTRFNIAPSYFGSYFKKNFGISYRDYVNQYRLQLIEKRMLNNKLALKEIATEFGFTDESHLSHYFKKQKSVSPKEFKTNALKS